MDILDQWEKEAIVKPPVFKQYEHTYDFDTKDRQKIRTLIAVVRIQSEALRLQIEFEPAKTFDVCRDALAEAERILNAS